MQNILMLEFKKKIIGDILYSINTLEKIQKFENYKSMLGNCKIMLFDEEKSNVGNTFADFELGSCGIYGIGDYTKTWILDSEHSLDTRKLALGKTVVFDLNVMTYLNKIVLNRKMGEGMDKGELVDFFNYIKNDGFQIGIPNALMERTKKPYDSEILHEMIRSYAIYENRKEIYVGIGGSDLCNEEKNRIKQLYELADRIKYDMYDQYEMIWCCVAKAYLIKKHDRTSTKDKVVKFIRFCLNELNCYAENEIVLLSMYILDDERTIETFKKLNKQKNIKEHISNIAWDIYHIRCLENMMKIDNAIGNDKIVLPYLSTADKGLINAMKINPIKAYIILDDYSIAVRKFTVESVCKNVDILEEIESGAIERSIKIRQTNLKELHLKLSNEICENSK